MAFKFSNLLGKKDDYPAEYKRFKKALAANPNDQGLKSQFIRFCLLNRFTGGETSQENVAEALRLFEAIQSAPTLDLQCHYMVGKYYQEERDFRKAYGVYLAAIKRFNGYGAKNPDLRSENSELAYSLALNLMTLQSDPVDPEVEVCFKIIRKSFPLHLKRIQYENEMAKPAPDAARVKKLAEEIRQLRAEDEKEMAQAAAVKDAPSKPAPASAQPSPEAAQPGPSQSPANQDLSGVASAKPEASAKGDTASPVKPEDKPAEKIPEATPAPSRSPLFSSSSQIQDAEPAQPVQRPVRHSGSTELAEVLGETGSPSEAGISPAAASSSGPSGRASATSSGQVLSNPGGPAASTPVKNPVPSGTVPPKTLEAPLSQPVRHSLGESGNKEKGIFSKLFNELAPGALGLTPAGLENAAGGKATGHRQGKETLHITPSTPSAGDPSSTFMAYHDDRWEGPFTSAQLRSMGFLKPATWVCRSGSQQVLQAYEVPDLQQLFQP